MNVTLISAAVGMVIGFGSAWQIQSWRNLRDENNRITIAAENERIVSRVESARRAQNIAAQNARALRESKLRLDAATAHAAVNSLRGAIATVVQASRSDPATCPDTSVTLGNVLADSIETYTELAATCDRHVTDIQTLTGAGNVK